MKNLYILLFLLLIAITNVVAQVTFQRTIGGPGMDVGQSIQQTTDGGYIIAGYTQSFGAGGQDVYLIKSDASGNIVWAKTYGGAGDDVGKCVRQTNDGGYIVGGWTTSFGQGGNDFYYFKTDANGNLMWSKSFGGASLDLIFSCQQTVDGGYAFFGWTASFGAGDGDYYLLKTDANGTVEWNKTYGWSGDEYGLWFEQTTDHGFIMTGTCNSQGAGGFDVLIIKADSAGGLEWAKTYGGLLNDGGSFIRQTSDGGYINVGGTPSFGAGSSDVYLIRTDSIGDTLWTKTYGNTGSDGGNCVRQDVNGNFIVSANYDSGPSSQGWLFKTDGNGIILWSKYYGGAKSEDSFTFWQTSDDGFALTGSSTSFGAGAQDIYILKTDSLGNSGCNDTTQEVFITTRPHTIVTSPVPFVNSGGISANAATTVRSGGTIDSLCASVANLPSPSFLSSDSTLCANDCINFTDLSTNNPTSWQWSFPGGTPSSSTDQNPQYICYLTGGIYNVTLVVFNGNGSNTLTLNNFITVHPAPLTPVITQSYDTLFCSTDPGYRSYQWYAGNTIIPGATDSILVTTHSDNYNVDVTDTNGCSIAVGILPFGIHDYFMETVISLSPNPATNQLNIHFSTPYKNKEIIVSVINTLGQEVSPSAPLLTKGENATIYVGDLTAGVYFLKLKTESGMAVKGFIKE